MIEKYLYFLIKSTNILSNLIFNVGNPTAFYFMFMLPLD